MHRKASEQKNLAGQSASLWQESEHTEAWHELPGEQSETSLHPQEPASVSQRGPFGLAMQSTSLAQPWEQTPCKQYP
jgi:hypothetical protein